MVTEFCARGSMYDVLQKAANSPMVLAPQLDWTRRLGMALDAAKVFDAELSDHQHCALRILHTR
jgi:hypothetical protein